MPAIYVHVPFCKQKCKYCDFNSYAGLDSVHQAYVKAVMHEIASQAQEIGVSSVESIYIGGGTPTLLEPSHVTGILSVITGNFNVSRDVEISIEANPETVTEEKLEAIRDSGVNRISIGFQSLDDGILELLGRKHSADQAVNAFKAAREAGFDNINIDMIFGIPGQSIANWAINIEQAASLDPEHISCYGLTIEPGTALEREIAQGTVGAPDEDLQADMLTYTIESLADSDFEHYEISNYSKPGKRCRHNLAYWNNDDYIGFGAGAHSKIGNKRFYNIAKPGEYIKAIDSGNHVADVIDLSIEDIMSETVFLGLRKIDGLELKEFEARFGQTILDVYGAQVNELLEDGLIENKNGSLRLTHRGLLLGNEVFSRFV